MEHWGTPPPPEVPENGILDHDETRQLLILYRHKPNAIMAADHSHAPGYGGLTRPIPHPEPFGRLISKGLQNTLANPPNGVRDKFKTPGFIKALRSFNQTQVTFVN